MSFPEQQHVPDIKLVSTKLTKLTSLLIISFSFIFLLGCSSNADCNTISNTLQTDKYVDVKLKSKRRIKEMKELLRCKKLHLNYSVYYLGR